MAASRTTASPSTPRSGARLVAANSGWQLVTFAARAVAGLGVVVLVARAGGPRSLGVFQFALMLSSILPFYYGVPPLLAREVARAPEQSRRWIEAGTLVALVAGAGFAGLLVLGTAVSGASGETLAAVQLAAAGMAFDGIARVQFAVFWAWERMHLEAVVTSVQEAAFLAATVAALAAGGGAMEALVAFAASRALGAGLGWLVVGRRLGAVVVPRASLPFLRSTLRRCTSFAVNDTLTLAHSRADAVMLGMIKGPVAVGLHQAGTNLVLYFNVLARSLNHALYPRMSKAWPVRPDQFRRLRDASLRSIGLVAVPIAVGCLLLAPRTFDVLYGPEFDRAVLAYQVLILVIPLRMLSHTLSISLAAADRQNRRVIGVATVTALNIGLNLYMIPRWSYLGAAVTAVVCETVLMLMYAYFLRRVAGGSRIPRSLVLPLAASVPMAGAVLVTTHQHLLVSVALGSMVYALAVLGLAVLRAPAAGRRPAKALVALVRPAP